MDNSPQDETATFLPIDDKTARRAMQDFEKLTNQVEKEIARELKRLERQNELEQRNSIIQHMVKHMRDNGASDRSIQIALPGLSELAKFSSRAKSSPASHNPENPDTPPAPIEEAPGLLLSEIEAQPVRWLWEKRIPLGKITMLDGDPGMGKSLLAIQIAACVTTGHPMPDGTPGLQGGVILIAPEDGAGDTLKPRLEAAGGDPSHVLLLNTVESLDAKKIKVNDRPFSLSHDLELLEEAIKRTGAVLVILDPLMAILGHRLSASRDQDVREVFTPLAQLAERRNCAVLIICHLSKSASQNALYRGAGSIGIIAAARTGLIVTQHPYEQNSRVLATSKNNLSKQASNLTYQVIENECGIPCIQWLGENNYTLPTLLDGGANLSLERQKILQVLKGADGPLGIQEFADLTGQKYISVRLTLSRMHRAGEIIRQHRGLYTTLYHPSLLRNGGSADTSDTLDTNDTNDTVANSRGRPQGCALTMTPKHDDIPQPLSGHGKGAPLWSPSEPLLISSAVSDTLDTFDRGLPQMNSTKQNQLKVPGASLYYETRGSGPVLLMIPGGPTDANIFAGLAPRLADSYTVVTYDPRGLSRSKLDALPEHQRIVEIMTDDSHRLLAAVGSEPAYVFANSGGAIIGLELATHHSQQVRTLVAHEPPAAVLLPDGPALLTAMQEVYDTYRSVGIGPAMQQFFAAAGLAGGPPPGEAGPQDEPTPEMLEEMRQMQQNMEFFLAHYLRPVAGHQPDIAALSTSSTRIVAAVGDASAGQLAYRCAVELAGRLGTRAVVFPGDHTGFLTHSDKFAATLHQVLAAG